MAEFNEVVKEFNRMDRTFRRDCKDCPMPGQNIGQCRKLLFDAPETYEHIVMHWAAEHPGPKYPTWEEWQKTNFPDAESAIFPCSFDSKKNVGCNRVESCKGCRAHPIPAEIAKKLGIKPKGGHGNDGRY